MKLDMHTHGKLAKKLAFAPEYTDWLFREANEAGLDALCLTEHFNTLGFAEVYQYISENYEEERDTFLTREGLRIFPGMEVDIAEGEMCIRDSCTPPSALRSWQPLSLR